VALSRLGFSALYFFTYHRCSPARDGPRLLPFSMKPLTSFVSILFTGVVVPGAVVEKQDVFTAGTGGYAGYRIPVPVVTPRQTLLAACEASRPTLRDWGHIDLVMRRSLDGGASWQPARVLVGQDDLPGDVQRNPAAVERNLGVSGALPDADRRCLHRRYSPLFLRRDPRPHSSTLAVRVFPLISLRDVTPRMRIRGFAPREAAPSPWAIRTECP